MTLMVFKFTSEGLSEIMLPSDSALLMDAATTQTATKRTIKIFGNARLLVEISGFVSIVCLRSIIQESTADKPLYGLIEIQNLLVL